MSVAHVTQISGTAGGLELLFKLDAFLVNTLGFSREYYTGGSWPASYTSLAYADVVGWRAPTSSQSRFEVAAVVTVVDGSTDQFTFQLSPLISSSQGIAVGAGANFGTNPSVTIGPVSMSNSDFRYSLRGDADHVFCWIEYTSNDNGFYLGRVENPRETSTVDPFPVVGWAGKFRTNLPAAYTSFLYNWRRVYSRDASTALTAGALHILRHPSTAADDILYLSGNGQTTLTSANWQWLTPLIGFHESSKIEYPGSPIGFFLTENDSTKSLWGADLEWAKINGVITIWPEGVAIKTAYP